MDGENTKTFNYDSIPLGFYDEVLDQKDGMRKFWHWHKFDSVKRMLNIDSSSNLLDVGCFAGTFIGRFLKDTFSSKVGVDILPDQIAFASNKYTDKTEKYISINSFADLSSKLETKFSNVTFIEVIEHLNSIQIKSFFENIDLVTDVNSEMIITTPNYASIWPLLEFAVNRVSKVKYEEQHITKFTYFNIERKLCELVPGFDKKYKVLMKTTSHFITPFIACFFYKFAIKISQVKNVSKWKNPFGAMVIIKVVKIA